MQRKLFLRILLLIAVLSVTRDAFSAEPAREFLNELRNNNLYDIAVEYIDRMKDSPLVPAEFKETLTYERGVTLVKGAHFVKDANLREKQLDEAQVVLKDFIANQPRHVLASSANNELGNLLAQRAGLR